MAYPSASTYPAHPDSSGSATQPTLSVAGRVDGEAYTVTAGARSLSISAQVGATLLTTVEQASTGAAVTVTGSTTTTPSWTAPAGTTVGEACNVLTVATLGGLTSHVGYTEFVEGSGGGGGGGASWEDVEDVDCTTVTDSGPHTSGVQSFAFTDYASVSVTASRVSPNTGNIEAVNGTGIVVTGTGNGSMRAGVLLTDILTAYDREYALGGMIAVHVVYEVVWGAANGNGPIVGLNSVVSHNSGNLRGYRGSYDNSDGSEDQQVRSNTSNPTFNTLGTAATSGVVTTILHAGEIVELMWTAGSTPPTPAPGASDTEMVGGGSVGVQASTIGYDPLYEVITATLACTITVKRILIQRYQ